MTSKRWLPQLQNAILASVAHFKKRKLERTHRLNTEQPRIDDNKLSTDDTGDTGDTDEKGTWFWNQSTNELASDSECNGYSDEEGDLGPEGSKTEEEALTQKQPKERNQSANELESDSECNGYSDEEGDLGPEGFKLKRKPLLKSNQRK